MSPPLLVVPSYNKLATESRAPSRYTYTEITQQKARATVDSPSFFPGAGPGPSWESNNNEAPRHHYRPQLDPRPSAGEALNPSLLMTRPASPAPNPDAPAAPADRGNRPRASPAMAQSGASSAPLPPRQALTRSGRPLFRGNRHALIAATYAHVDARVSVATEAARRRAVPIRAPRLLAHVTGKLRAGRSRPCPCSRPGSACWSLVNINPGIAPADTVIPMTPIADELGDIARRCSVPDCRTRLAAIAITGAGRRTLAGVCPRARDLTRTRARAASRERQIDTNSLLPARPKALAAAMLAFAAHRSD